MNFRYGKFRKIWKLNETYLKLKFDKNFIKLPYRKWVGTSHPVCPPSGHFSTTVGLIQLNFVSAACYCSYWLLNVRTLLLNYAGRMRESHVPTHFRYGSLIKFLSNFNLR